MLTELKKCEKGNMIEFANCRQCGAMIFQDVSNFYSFIFFVFEQMAQPIKHFYQNFETDESPTLQLDTLFTDEVKWDYSF